MNIKRSSLERINITLDKNMDLQEGRIDIKKRGHT
jgi:hypothetical protein